MRILLGLVLAFFVLTFSVPEATACTYHTTECNVPVGGLLYQVYCGAANDIDAVTCFVDCLNCNEAVATP